MNTPLGVRLKSIDHDFLFDNFHVNMFVPPLQKVVVIHCPSTELYLLNILLHFFHKNFIFCQDRKISLNLGHYEKYKSNRTQVNYSFCRTKWKIVKNIENIENIKKYTQKIKYFKSHFCFCSHFPPLRTQRLIFYMVEDNVPYPTAV